MTRRNARKFLLAAGIAVVLGLSVAAFAAAAEATSKPPARTAKPAKKAKKATTAKKEPAASQRPACVADSGKKWGEGKHCMSKCNAQGSLCDMRICKEGNWKPYSSCFGPNAVAPNCPVACD